MDGHPPSFLIQDPRTILAKYDEPAVQVVQRAASQEEDWGQGEGSKGHDDSQ